MSFLETVATKIAIEAIEVVAKEVVDALSDEDTHEKEIEHVAELGGKHD